MNEIKIFENQEFGKIRTITECDKILFCGSDVAKTLGYNQPHKAIERHCKKDGGMFHTVTDSLGRQQLAKFINEGNLYRLIVNSKLPSAEKFECWVFDEVLPSIRKHRLYATDELIANPDIAIAAFTALKEERERNKTLSTQIAVKEQIIQELQPKATYYDLVLNCKDLLSTTQISKDYGKSAIQFNRLLHELGIQFSQSGVWLLYQKYADKGYTSTTTYLYDKRNGTKGAKVHTYWTQKGRLFVYELLKNNGYIPLIEQEK